MEKFITYDQINQAAAFIQTQTKHQPQTGLILGSGLSDLADLIENPDTIPYTSIPHWPVSRIQGHNNQLVIGQLASQTIAVMQGRTHYYEGYSMSEITMPVRVLQKLGMKTLILTNAAGAINPDFVPGDIMLITDLINMIGMGGNNPLRGPNLEEFGPRFPDMSQMMDRELMDIARKIAKKEQISLREGVYNSLAGPSFESPADLRFLQIIGADAVGMSTSPEAIVARHGNVRVLGISGITNKANLDGNTETTHEEVLQSAATILPKLQRIILGVLGEL